MDELSSRISRLGKTVGEADAPDEEAIAAARDRWGKTGATSPALSRRTPLAAAAVIAAATGIAGWVWWEVSEESAEVSIPTPTEAPGERDGAGTDSPPPAPLSFEVDSTPGEAGRWLAARSEPVELQFSEGTRVELGRGARVRVSDVRVHGASIDLERGELQASVQHLAETEWDYRAGPYTVRVTGTRFWMRWDPERGAFEIRMLEGSVEVEGPSLETPRPVLAGRTLRAWVDEERLEILRTPDDPSAVSMPAPSTSAGATASAPAPTTVAAPDVPTWREMLRERGHPPARVLAEVERAGLSNTTATATVDELYLIADTARLAGRPDRARQVLLALRTRHRERGRTAFLLGRMAAESGEHAEATRWLETYLQESPRGPLSEAALGRLIELTRQSRPDRSRELARRYLERFPTGSYATLARSVATP